jgi:hypothetical protein
VPGSQKLVPLSSASETDDVAERMPTPSSATIAEDRSTDFTCPNLLAKKFKMIRRI